MRLCLRSHCNRLPSYRRVGGKVGRAGLPLPLVLLAHRVALLFVTKDAPPNVRVHKRPVHVLQALPLVHVVAPEELLLLL